MSDAAAAIAERAPGFTPRLGLMLGSGLGELAERLADRVEVPYAEIPGFHAGGLAGHAGTLNLGVLAGKPVAIFSGRWHVYQGIGGDAITTPIRMLRALGAEVLVLTNAAGSLRPEAGPGSLVCLSDHINMLGFNPLTGPNDDAVGPRFPSLRDAYDPELRARLHAAADALGTPLHDGVYLAVAGPTFETPGGDPRVPDAGRGPRRHEHRPRGDRRPPRRPARRRDLGRDEPRRGHGRRGALARPDAARRQGGRGAPRPADRALRRRTSRDPAGADPQEARRRHAHRRGAGVHRRGHRHRRAQRRADRRLRDGRLLPRPDRSRAGRAHGRDDALGRGPAVGRRPRARQALHRRRRRQGLAAARADPRRVRRQGADDLRPRPRPHRRHARQARLDPGLQDGARPRAPAGHGGGGGLRDHRPDARPGARRPPLLRAARRDRDRRVDPADRRLDPLQEARGRARRPRHGRQGRLGRVPAGAGALGRARARDRRRRPRQRPRLRGAAHRHGPGARPHRGQRRRGAGGARRARPPARRGAAAARGHAGAVRHPAAARRRPRDRRGGARRRRRGAHQRRGRRALRRDEPRPRRPGGHRRRPGPPPAARAARAGGLPRGGRPRARDRRARGRRRRARARRRPPARGSGDRPRRRARRRRRPGGGGRPGRPPARRDPRGRHGAPPSGPRSGSGPPSPSATRPPRCRR